jgi:hypothetical protein
MSHRTARTLSALLLVVILTVSGCLTLSPSVTADTDASPVFDTFSTNESWGGQHVRTDATLESTPEASNVTTITVIDESGQSYSTVSVDSGQTAVSVWVPTNQNSTLVASNSVNSTTIDTMNVTATGEQTL